MTELKNQILEKIESGKVAMRPQWQFVLMTALYVIATLIVALVAMYLLSFVFFTLRETGLGYMSHFGFAGLIFLVTRSPWILILLTLAFLGILSLLVKEFSFSYRRPLLYSLVGVVLFVLIIAALIHTFALHNRIDNFSRGHNLPGLAPLYRDVAGTRPKGITPGRIEAVTQTGFTLRTPEGTVMTVVVTETTRGANRQLFAPGTPVLVFGEAAEGVIEAKGIRPIDRDLPPALRGR